MDSRPVNPATYNPRDVSPAQGDLFIVLQPYTAGGDYDATFSITGQMEAFGRHVPEVQQKNIIAYFNAP
jgi:hypothetical protein